LKELIQRYAEHPDHKHKQVINEDESAVDHLSDEELIEIILPDLEAMRQERRQGNEP
jgi:hypothetical protein